MSRRHPTARRPGYVVTVGWDNPLSTFFAQVTRSEEFEDEDDFVVLWIGTFADEVRTPEELAGPLAPYADLTPEVVARLRDDRAACIARGPTDLQRTLLA